MPELTDPRREQFCQEYLIDLCAAKAARRAGYSHDQARKIGSRLMGEAVVAARIDELKRERADRTQARQDRVIEELMAVAFADMRDFLEWGPDGYRLTRSDDLTPQQTAAVLEVSETIGKMGITRTIKLHPKLKALEMLARQLGMKGEQVNVEHTGALRFLPPTAPPDAQTPEAPEAPDA